MVVVADGEVGAGGELLGADLGGSVEAPKGAPVDAARAGHQRAAMTIADERVVADRQILGRIPRPRIGLRSARFLWGGSEVHGENRTLFYQWPSSAAA